MAQNEITLKVAEALSQRDIGQGIARLDPKTMSEISELMKETLSKLLVTKKQQQLPYLHKPTLVLE